MKIKTKSGFECEIEKESMNDMRIVDAIAEISDGNNALALPYVIKALLGKDGKERLYKHVEDGAGRVPIEKISGELLDIFSAMGDEGKNS